jgi:phage baseplate assembly protein W
MADENMLGVDIKLSSEDINFDIKNDVSINKPKDNLPQAVINRLKTPKGFYTLHPEYGSYLYRVLGKPKIDSTLIYARQVIHEALLQEPRIETIETVTTKYKDNDNVMEIFIQVTTLEDINPYNIVFDYFLNVTF